jgi:hypothetical protein
MEGVKMRKTMSLKQLEANRANAQKSTGPKTAEGRSVSKWNALKHGILSKQVLIGGIQAKESRNELAKLHQQFRDDWQPVGVTEEMLVDQIVTAHWRLRRALAAEAGEIALNVDGEHWKRENKSFKLTTLLWDLEGDPTRAMQNSALGNRLMENQLREVRKAVETEGELTEAVLQEVKYHGQPYSLTERLRAWRMEAQQNPEGLAPEELRVKQKERLLAKLSQEINLIYWRRTHCEEREEQEEKARQAAALLPAVEVLEKIQRYETKLERQIFRAMAQLERLQRMRRGEVIPAPLNVEISGRRE